MRIGILVILSAILAISSAYRCYGPSMGNQVEFPCNKYFHICRDHIEGYEGYLRLPVLQEMNPQKMSSEERKLFENGDIRIEFSHSLDVLHAPEEDHGLRVAMDKGNKQNFTLFVKDVYRDRMERLTTGNYYRMDLTWRSNLFHPNILDGIPKEKVIGIRSIKFGNFICSEPPAPIEEVFPACRIFMIDASITDGYQAIAVFTVPSTKDQWIARMKFPVPIRNFDTPTGDGVRISEDEFEITSLRHNGKQREGHEFHLEFTVHVYGIDDAQRKLNRWEAKKIVEMSFNEYVCRGAVITRKWLY